MSSATIPSLTTTNQQWLLGHDTQDENINGNLTETRSSIHGDVIHSRPLPVNYGNSTIVVYYGANDGNLRAVDANSGQELWSFIPYEFMSELLPQPLPDGTATVVDRLRENLPLVNFPNVSTSITPTPIAKNYFWDGSVGLLQNADNSKVWIYPTMRRGGRFVYSFDVTTPTSPAIKWKAGCPDLTDDTGCTTGMNGIGETWAIPNVAPIKGYSTSNLAVVLGGGYDSCEDANTKSPSCTSPKGAAVYILDANDGTLLKTLATTRSVAADVAMIDIDGDGYADYAYALDTGGALYRISFVSRNVDGTGVVSYPTLSPVQWTITKIAQTNNAGEGRKFLFAPTLLGTGPKTGMVYVAMGTGDREHPLITDYPSTATVQNRFYVFLDNLATTPASPYNLDDAAAMNNVSTDLGCTSPPVLPASGKQGWFMNLPGTGEQTVTSALIVGGLVAFSTNQPIPPAAASCSTPLGQANGYWVNLFSGSGTIGVSGTCGGARSGIFVGGGLPPSPVIGTVPVGGNPTTVIIGTVQREGGASSPISPQKSKPPISQIRKRVYFYSPGNN